MRLNKRAKRRRKRKRVKSKARRKTPTRMLRSVRKRVFYWSRIFFLLNKMVLKKKLVRWFRI
jgi:hypothetical protein